jgi:thymidylate synthase (FAD)
MENLHFLPDPSRIQQQGKANKQGSGASMDEMFSRELIEDLKDEQEHVYGNYEEAIKAGVAKEIARINTPVSRYSKMRAKTDLLNWLRFVNLRLRPNAQAEIRQYAEAVATFLKWRFPKTMELFEEHDLYGVQFSRKEMDAIRRWSLRGENLDQAAAAAGLSGSELKEFQKKIEKGGKEIL